MQPPLFLWPERTGVFITTRTLRGVLPCWAVRLECEGVLVTPERSDPNVWAHLVCSGCAQESARTLKRGIVTLRQLGVKFLSIYTVVHGILAGVFFLIGGLW